MNIEVIFKPYTGPDTLEFKEVTPFLVDVKEGGTKGCRREKEGIGEVLYELAVAMPKLGDAAGISQAVYAEIVEGTSRIEKLRALRGQLEKALEVVEETEAVEEHKRESNIAIVADTVKMTARRKDESVLAPFEKTLNYHAQFAEKAWKTRRRNKKEAAEQAKQAAPAKQAEAPQKPAQPEASAENQ